MTVVDRMERFSGQFGKHLVVDGVGWRYYRLGVGTPVLWLTGGLRRAALGFAFLERLAARHTVIAPDYPPVRTMEQLTIAFDSILRAERVGTFDLVGQSYGGMLAQAYLAHRITDVHRLVLSSAGPADYGRAWLPAEELFITLARVLPERALKSLLAAGLLRLVGQLPQHERAEMAQVITAIVHKELSRADVVSHFAVAADLIRTQVVNPAAFQRWNGRAVVLSAENDPTQSKKDLPRYERLFSGRVDVISLGRLGHAAVLVDPNTYADLLERALA